MRYIYIGVLFYFNLLIASDHGRSSSSTTREVEGVTCTYPDTFDRNTYQAGQTYHAGDFLLYTDKEPLGLGFGGVQDGYYILKTDKGSHWEKDLRMLRRILGEYPVTATANILGRHDATDKKKDYFTVDNASIVYQTRGTFVAMDDGNGGKTLGLKDEDGREFAVLNIDPTNLDCARAAQERIQRILASLDGKNIRGEIYSRQMPTIDFYGKLQISISGIRAFASDPDLAEKEVIIDDILRKASKQFGEQATDADMALIHSDMLKLPVKVLRTIAKKGWRVYLATGHQHLKRWEGNQFAQGATGAADFKSKEVWIKSNFLQSERDLVPHEIGHAYDSAVSKSGSPASLQDHVFNGARETDIKILESQHSANGQPFDPYPSNILETYAITFAEYVLGNRRFPATYDYFEREFGKPQ